MNQPINRAPKWLFVLGSLALISIAAGGYFLWRGQKNAATDIYETAKAPVERWKNWHSKSEDTGTENVIPAAEGKMSLSELRSNLDTLESLFLELERTKKLYEKSDRERFKTVSKDIKDKIRELRQKLRGPIMNSDLAREQVFRMIETSNDPQAKNQLARLLSETDPKTQTKFFTDLAQTNNDDNKQVAVKMLAGVNTIEAIDGMKGVAQDTQTESRVRSEAIRGVGRGAVVHESPEYRAKAKETLRSFTASSYDPQIRKSAYEAMWMNPYLTPEDKKFIDQAAATETDPKVKQSIQFAQRVAEASLRSKEKRQQKKTSRQ